MIHDYTRKRGIVHSEILLPPNAPSDFQDRGALWNSVEQIEKACNSHDIASALHEQQHQSDRQTAQRERQSIRSEHERLQKLLMSLYESLADGIIDRDEYARLKQNYAGRCAECEKQMDALQETLTQIKEHGGGHREWMAQFRKHLNITELERSIVVALIDRILIYRDNRVEVRFRFADEFAWQTDILRRAQIREVV